MKNKIVKALAMALAMTTVTMMGSVGVFAEEAAEEAAGEEEEEDTGEPSETPGEVYQPSVNADAPNEQAIMVISFGTSFNDNRTATIKGLEDAIVAAFPEYDVRRAFTSQIIIDKLKERDNVLIDNVTEALDRAVADGVKTLVVQPTHLMNGHEYDDVMEELANYGDAFESIVVGEPLLTSDEDFSAVIEAIAAGTEEYDDGDTAICFMGHGTDADSNEVYQKMDDLLKEEGYANYYVGTVEATPTLEDVIASVGEGEYSKVLLQPLMVVAGDHANNDMAGDEEDSWKSAFEAAGYEVQCELVGLGQMADIQNIYIEHTADAIAQLD
ncbi:MAG: sirohydrochlorin cobaltochelatase [Eubacteriales bacterium]|nr:sirohydrochlorin cobaltochelatase [Eubacteriales bacterium]